MKEVIVLTESNECKDEVVQDPFQQEDNYVYIYLTVDGRVMYPEDHPEHLKKHTGTKDQEYFSKLKKS